MFIIIILIAIILFAIIFEVIFLILTIISFAKKKKANGFIFLSFTIIIPFILFLMYIGFTGIIEPRTLGKSEIISALEKEKIIIDNDFEIINSKNEEDLYFYRTQFKIKLSNSQFEKMPKNDTLKNFTSKNNAIFDTIRIILSENQVLDFYKSNHDFNN